MKRMSLFILLVACRKVGISETKRLEKMVDRVVRATVKIARHQQCCRGMVQQVQTMQNHLRSSDACLPGDMVQMGIEMKQLVASRSCFCLIAWVLSRSGAYARWRPSSSSQKMSISFVERGAFARRSIYAPPSQEDANRLLESSVFEFCPQLGKITFNVCCFHLCSLGSLLQKKLILLYHSTAFCFPRSRCGIVLFLVRCSCFVTALVSKSDEGSFRRNMNLYPFYAKLWGNLL